MLKHKKSPAFFAMPFYYAKTIVNLDEYIFLSVEIGSKIFYFMIFIQFN